MTDEGSNVDNDDKVERVSDLELMRGKIKSLMMGLMIGMVSTIMLIQKWYVVAYCLSSPEYRNGTHVDRKTPLLCHFRVKDAKPV